MTRDQAIAELKEIVPADVSFCVEQTYWCFRRPSPEHYEDLWKLRVVGWIDEIPEVVFTIDHESLEYAVEQCRAHFQPVAK